VFATCRFLRHVLKKCVGARTVTEEQCASSTGRYIIAHKSAYYQLLLNITQHEDWEPWLLYIIEGLEQTASWTTAKINAIRELEKETIQHVRSELPKIYTRELVEMIFTQPYCRISNLVDAGIAHRQSASKYLKELARIGVLRELHVGKEKLFIHTKLMELLREENNHIDPYSVSKS